MKRMNLIHGALFAVLTFMGTISLSAQQNWLPPADAAVAINNQLAVLDSPTPPPAKVLGGNITKTAVGETSLVGGCSDCLLKSVKIRFLEQVLLRIKQGMPVGTAVDEVRAMFIGGSNNDPGLLQAIETAYVFVVDILS